MCVLRLIIVYGGIFSPPTHDDKEILRNWACTDQSKPLLWSSAPEAFIVFDWSVVCFLSALPREKSYEIQYEWILPSFICVYIECMKCSQGQGSLHTAELAEFKGWMSSNCLDLECPCFGTGQICKLRNKLLIQSLCTSPPTYGLWASYTISMTADWEHPLFLFPPVLPLSFPSLPPFSPHPSPFLPLLYTSI